VSVAAQTPDVEETYSRIERIAERGRPRSVPCSPASGRFWLASRAASAKAWFEMPIYKM
jgi:hypothetical protein